MVQPKIWMGMRDELEKIALNRFERAMQSGEIGRDEAWRAGGDSVNAFMSLKQPSAVPTEKENPMRWFPGEPKTIPHTPKRGELHPGDAMNLRDSRQAMWSPGATDLSPDQLARHRKLQGMQADHAMKSLGGIHENHPLMGPATVGGKVLVGDNAGSYVRQAGEGSLGNPLKANAPSFLRKAFGWDAAAQPVDSTLRHAVVQHEGGEKALLQGIANSDKPRRFWGMLGMKQDPSAAVPARSMASHFGGTPILEEKQVTWRDPGAQSAMEKLRQLNPDDARMDALHRQFGGRPDSPLPLGGRAHAKFEQRIGGMVPQVGQAASSRMNLAQEGLSHGIPMSRAEEVVAPFRNIAENLESGAKQVGGLGGRALGAIGNLMTKRLDKQVGGALGHAVDPSNLANRLMKLRSAVRR